MAKIITKTDHELIRRAINRIADPVIQTLTPLGNNVMFEKDLTTLITNDGVTIAKLIDSEDEVEDTIIQMVKYGSLATNKAAGDGTSSTILYTKTLVDLGLDAIEAGQKPMLLRDSLLTLRDKILRKASKFVTEVEPDDWFKIAMISSGGDAELASNVVSIIETAGLDGMVFINDSKNNTTKIVKDTGYGIDNAMVDPILGNLEPGRAGYDNPHVFITDKKLYHIEECKEILESAYNFGATNLVIVARDFVGEAPGYLIANHMDEKVPLNVLLLKYKTPDNDFTPLYDLATYLGATVVSEKRGSFKGKLTADDYTMAHRVHSGMDKTIIVSDKKANPELTMLIDSVRKKKEEDPDNEALASRLASLTTGTVKIEIGASTGPEMRELMFRYEDAINAVRASIRSGYVVGGGLTLFNATRGLDKLALTFGESSIRQIAHNCGIDFELDKYTNKNGYNAKTREYSNLLDDGVIEPFDVFKHSVTNAFSIAIAILTSGYIIVDKIKKDGK